MCLSSSVVDSKAANDVPQGKGNRSTDWANALLPVCFGTSMTLTMMSVQDRSEIPTIIHLVSLGVMFAAATFLVSKFMVPKFPTTAHVVERVGVFVMVTAFFVATSDPLPLYFKATTWVVYVASLLVILVCSCL
ncbi:hypothetical protein TIFTF001_027125 [Ficus carica]|uniref:Uncharacterized protein n=1 Tax=Ficus carica TaxID=3494 RepID=A0AA88IZU1_FICCA|nr:hypothetical protein TIFTF001_027125 [Ficus carica]